MPTDQPQTYTIDLPGAADLIKLPIPALNNPQLKRERIQRLKTKAQPLPEMLQWIPGVINKLDDAQDLLFTGFFLAKPLLRRLPARFIPYIGWGLVAMDGLNLLTSLLGVATTPGFNKVRVLNCVTHARRCMIDPRQAFAQWLAKGGWRHNLAFVLQGAQALTTITGYGLQLGALIGAISDTIWGGIRALGGAQVRFRGPPPSDPFGKADRYLNQTLGLNEAAQLLSLEDHALLIAAQNLATSLVIERGIPMNDARGNELMSTQIPVYEPWEESSRAALIEEGWDPNAAIRPFGAFHFWTPTYQEMIDWAMAREANWQETFRSKTPDSEFWAAMFLLYDEAGLDTISYLSSIPEQEIGTFPRDILTIAKLADCGITWEQEPDRDTQALMIEFAMTLADAAGFRIPTCAMWEKAFKQVGVTFRPK